MPNAIFPDWEQVLASAAHLQCILPGAVLVGGSAAAFYSKHRLSTDADHVLVDLSQHFDQVLAELESVAGWKTARVTRPVQILGNLDGIETGIRQLIREVPLETVQTSYQGEMITIPSEAEILRIKGILILKRNATRDYLDFVALAAHLGAERMIDALCPFDHLYPQPNEESALLQLQIQLAQPMPYDLDELDLAEYKNLDIRWQNWQVVKSSCIDCAIQIFDQIIADKTDQLT